MLAARLPMAGHDLACHLSRSLTCRWDCVSQAIDGLNTAGATKEAVINLISASPGWVEIAFINARSTDIAKKFLADLLPLMGTIAKSNPLVRCASMHFVWKVLALAATC